MQRACRIAGKLASPCPTGAPGQSLASGAAGIALLHIERAATGTSGWQDAHAWLAEATRDPLSAGTSASLYHGAPAVAFTLHPASQAGYDTAHSILDKGVAALTRNRLTAAATRAERGERPALAEFDLISGLTGLGAHLWRHDPHGTLIREVLAYLVTLTEPGGGLPGWWTTSPARRTAPDPPGGHGNLGMAHGISVIFISRRELVT
jgi:hypothetical protein